MSQKTGDIEIPQRIRKVVKENRLPVPSQKVRTFPLRENAETSEILIQSTSSIRENRLLIRIRKK